MKITLRLLLLVFASSVIAPASGQAVNKSARLLLPWAVSIAGGTASISNTDVSGSGVQQLGVRLSRELTPHLRLELGYNKLNVEVYERVPRAAPGERWFTPERDIIANRRSYKMLDLNLISPVRFHHGRHTILHGIAASYSWGINQYSWPVGPTISVAPDYRKAQYIGICPNIGYAYSFVNGRCSIGAAYMLRMYAGRSATQQDLSLVAGFHF